MDKEGFVKAAALLLVKHFRNCVQHGAGFHSRIFQHLLHREGDYVGIGRSKAVADGAAPHPEHVVPCAVLMDQCRKAIENGDSDEVIADLLVKHWKIVYVSSAEAEYLDTREGLNLRDTMPQGWTFKDGDTYARLRLAKIEVLPPLSN